MPLAAAIVVDDLANRLVGQSGIASGSIKTSRVWPWAESDLPACRVFAGSESCELLTLGSPINQHILQVNVQYTCRAVADLDDVMHALASAGLQRLYVPAPPRKDMELLGIDRALATEGEAAVGVITLRFGVTFHVRPGSPETIL